MANVALIHRYLTTAFVAGKSKNRQLKHSARHPNCPLGPSEYSQLAVYWVIWVVRVRWGSDQARGPIPRTALAVANWFSDGSGQSWVGWRLAVSLVVAVASQ